jgi:general secretion pathway protein E
MTTPSSPDLPPLTNAASVPPQLERLLQQAVAARASDLHLVPAADGLSVSWRLDGVLHPVGVWPKSLAANVLARLKVLADLLTYRTDWPQEGRLRGPASHVEMRLSTFPTLHGEKAVIRLFVGSGQYKYLTDLQFPSPLQDALQSCLEQTSGVVLITGPAGSGKTTTAYAALRELQQRHSGHKSLVTLEDPIEAELPGVAQTQVHQPADFTYALGLRSLMRQDPDVILVGEIRDRETAETVFQAGLTGHLVISTFHAGSCSEAVTRLQDLGVEPYLLHAGLQGVLSQRLFRRLCSCAAPPLSAPPLADHRADAAANLAQNDTRDLTHYDAQDRAQDDATSSMQKRAPAIANAALCSQPVGRQPIGCPQCWNTGYRGRTVLAEFLPMTRLSPQQIPQLTQQTWAEFALAQGLETLELQARQALEAGVISWDEWQRVLGTSTHG